MRGFLGDISYGLNPLSPAEFSEQNLLQILSMLRGDGTEYTVGANLTLRLEVEGGVDAGTL